MDEQQQQVDDIAQLLNKLNNVCFRKLQVRCVNAGYAQTAGNKLQANLCIRNATLTDDRLCRLCSIFRSKLGRMQLEPAIHRRELATTAALQMRTAISIWIKPVFTQRSVGTNY